MLNKKLSDSSSIIQLLVITKFILFVKWKRRTRIVLRIIVILWFILMRKRKLQNLNKNMRFHTHHEWRIRVEYESPCIWKRIAPSFELRRHGLF